MWQEVVPSNLYQLKVQKQGGWQCQETGELIGNPMLISMGNLYLSESQLLMGRPDYSTTSFQQNGHLAKLSLPQYNSEVKSSWVLELRVWFGRGVLMIYRAARHILLLFLIRRDDNHPMNSKPRKHRTWHTVIARNFQDLLQNKKLQLLKHT